MCEPMAIQFQLRAGSVALPKIELNECNGCGVLRSSLPYFSYSCEVMHKTKITRAIYGANEVHISSLVHVWARHLVEIKAEIEKF